MTLIPDKPRRLVLELSQNCNLNCIMCGYGGHPIEESKFFDRKLLEKISQEKDFLSHITEIQLNGRGESTINPRFPELVEMISDEFPKARLSITSNLMFRNEEIINIFNSKNIDILVSIDSANKNDYESIRKGSNYELLVDRLNRIIKCHIIFTLQKNNLEQIVDIGEFSAKHGFGFILNIIRVDDPSYKTKFNQLLEANWNTIISQIQSLHNLIPAQTLFIPDQIWGRKIPKNLATTHTSWTLPTCPNLQEEIMIAYNGEIYPCCMFNSYLLGNLQTQRIEDIWRSKTRKDFVTNYRENYYCQKCEYMIHQ